MIKVMIADDQELIRQSLEIILDNKQDIELVGIAENGKTAVELARKKIPDIILMDIRMPEIDGIKCIRIIKEQLPQIKIIVLTTFDDDEYIYNALKYGASGYLLKGVSSKELVESIRTVYQGGALINPAVTAKFIKLFSKIANTDYTIGIDEQVLKNLSRNEVKIIKLIGRGMSNKEITDKLKFSEGTVRNYISSILNKLNLRDRTQIAILSIQIGMELMDLDE